MIRAPIPTNDADRLAELEAYRVLDTPNDPALDRICRLAQRVLALPYAMVSIVAADRQWLKASVRLGNASYPRDISLCAHTVHAGQPMVVPDTLQDPRFADNPLVTGFPGIRAYAGVPLAVASGHVLGTLCVVDKAPREFSEQDLETLRELAALVVNELEQARQAAELKDGVEHARQLEREAERQRLELVAAKEEAERANQAKSEFLSSMSHELRTPLNAVLGFAQLLMNSRREPLSERQRGQAEHIVRSGEHLLKLINEVLDLARIEAGQLHLSIESVAVGPLIDDCLLMLRAMAERRGIVLRARIDPRLPAAALDFTRGKQVLLNLLSNAIKYNRDGGSVVISALADQQGVSIEVRDTGAGIPLERQAELFKPFSRLGQESGGPEGTGIGLTITQRLVQQMHGRISFESTAGVGSTFTVVFPLASGGQPQAGAGAALALNGLTGLTQRASRLLLYVEDNPANLTLMRELIAETDNLELISAPSAELGIELARSRKPDLILMDINLPGMSGLEAARQLKRLPQTAAVPVIALSASVPGSSAARAEHEKVFAAYLAKPVNVAELLTTLEQFLPGDSA